MNDYLDRLRSAGIENPARELRILEKNFRGPELIGAIESRIAHKPMAKILGYRDFWLDRFFVNQHVLDPRPDSELFLEIAENISTRVETILDLGTGSGALGLSALRVFPAANATLADISFDALDVARSNAENLGLSERAKLVQSNWFDNITQKFDLILCNPPYLTAQELQNAQPELQFEPENALTDFEDGLTHYRTIALHLKDFLNPKGIALFEHGYSQQADVAQLFLDTGFSVKLYEDLNKKPRIVAVFLPEYEKIEDK